MTKVSLAKHNDMVKAIPPDGSDEPFRTADLAIDQMEAISFSAQAFRGDRLT
jgi:hypothetical protein